MNARFRLAVLGGLCSLASLPLGSGAAWSQASSGVAHITVIGQAHTDVAPDLAILSFAVVTEKPTAAAAESANAASAQALIQMLKAQGIEAQDIKTVSVTLAPVYDEQRDLVRNVSNRVLRGYRARDSLMVTVHDLHKVGALAGQLIGQGANEFDGISFESSQTAAALDRLRAEAVRNAMREAKAYLAPLRVSLGRVIDIAPQEYPVMRTANFATAASTAEPASIPIEPGTQRLEAQVSVTWEITP